MQRVNRIQPAMPVQNYQSYRIDRPIQTHWRRATCAEMECKHYLNGWTTIVPEGDLADQARNAGRRYTEQRAGNGMVRFAFPPGQPCFRTRLHRMPTGRPALYVVRGGDWRANTGVIRRHVNGDDWVDDFANHMDKLATRLNQG